MIHNFNIITHFPSSSFRVIPHPSILLLNDQFVYYPPTYVRFLQAITSQNSFIYLHIVTDLMHMLPGNSFCKHE
jgi:hypothetical protein